MLSRDTCLEKSVSPVLMLNCLEGDKTSLMLSIVFDVAKSKLFKKAK